MTVQIRQLRPSDYHPVISVVDSWWNGRHMAGLLPRLFFEHFTDTSFAAERDGELARLPGRAPVTVTPGRGLYPFHPGVHPAERRAALAGSSTSASSPPPRHGALAWSGR